MELIVNDNAIDFTLENETTVGEVLGSLEEQLEKNAGTIFKIIIDGKEIIADEIANLSSYSIENTKKVEIEAVFADELLKALKNMVDPIKRLNVALENIPVYIQGAEKALVPQILTTFADIFDLFCHFVTLTTLFPDIFANKTVQGKSLQEFIQEFSPFLEDLETATKENDSVLLGDIAEYEIKPRFEALAEALETF